MTELYIGLMSGTSMDAVDAILVDFSNTPYVILATHSEVIPQTIRQDLLHVCQERQTQLQDALKLDVLLGKLFAQTCLALIGKLSISKSNIIAIGSHGQTIVHQPDRCPPASLQIADPNVIVVETGITTVTDFRRRDLVLGGQGAPLTPLFHQQLFADENLDTAVVNIGGIANISFLFCDPKKNTIGFDTGPGNVLLDLWVKQHLDKPFDHQGSWAATGRVNHSLLKLFLSDPYFQKAPPKSTGRAYFNLDWLGKYLQQCPNKPRPQTIQATLTALTATTIAQAIQSTLPKQSRVIVCGGGALNDHLVNHLNKIMTSYQIVDCQSYGVHPKWLESMAFAWLAKQTIDKQAVNLTAITGSSKPSILGGVYYA